MEKLGKIVLASASPRRAALLRQVGCEAVCVFGVDADETPRKSETPRELAGRLARAKAELGVGKLAEVGVDFPCFLVSADTVVGVGRRILPKTQSVEEARACLGLLSGRAHRVFTGVCVVAPDGVVRLRVVETRVKFKVLGGGEVERYLRSGEWEGKAGGYAIQGCAEKFVVQMSGSYSNVVGLPLYETCNLLYGLGFKACK